MTYPGTPLRDRVLAGAAWLDEEIPGWRDRVAINDLDLSSPCSCVLGQLFENVPDAAGYENGYDYATAEVLESPQAVEYGFDFYTRSPNDAYKELTDLWQRVIKGEPI